jgi:hypothetical protein
MLSCQKATELMSMQVEKKLPANKRLSLAFHLTMCKGCKNFQKQMQLMHDACNLLPEKLFQNNL